MARVLIKEIADFNPQNIGKDFPYHNIEYIDTSSVEKGCLVKIQKINLKNAPSRAKRIIQKNDILISTVRPNLKHYLFVNESKENRIASTGFIVIRSHRVNPRFLYYYLTTPYYVEYLTGVAQSHTSAYPSFPPEIIENTEILLPSSQTQEIIANTLGSLDENIESLKKQNETLEKIIQAIFKSWFIDFDGQSEFIDSEFGEIPKGWQVKRIGEVCDTYGGGTPSTKKPEFWNGTIDWAIPSDLTESNQLFLKGTERKITKIGLENCPSKLHTLDSILMTSRATIGFFSINKVPIATNQGFIVIEPKSGNELYYLLNNFQNRISEFINNANGTTFLEISRGVFRKLPILVPTKKVLESFHVIVNPMYQKVFLNEKMIDCLTKKRDSLLPKLICGEIRV